MVDGREDRLASDDSRDDKHRHQNVVSGGAKSNKEGRITGMLVFSDDTNHLGAADGDAIFVKLLLRIGHYVLDWRKCGVSQLSHVVAQGLAELRLVTLQRRSHMFLRDVIGR